MSYHPSGQLNLFKGKRQRGTRPPPAQEFAVHCMVADILRRWAMPGWIWAHYPAGELRDTVTGARLKRMGTKPGVADFLLVAPPAGQLHALELKRKGERPNDEQAAFLDAVRAAGGMAAWVDNFDDAVRVLRDWGAVRASVSV